MDSQMINKVWGVVYCGTHTFLGAFCNYPEVGSNREGVEEIGDHEVREVVTKWSAEEIIELIEEDYAAMKVLHLSPVIEMFSPLQQVRQMTPAGEKTGLARTPVPTPFDFALGPVVLRVRPDAMTFIDEMTPNDQRTYMSFVDTVVRSVQAERASRVGIELVASLPGATRE